MTDKNASRTAVGTAYIRAVHQLFDEQPRILEDPVAVPLLGPEGLQRIRDSADRHRTPGACALRSHIVLRSRFAEDRLAAAVHRGITQYIILGAGFDTFALRQPEWARSLRILEVDHPGTQGMKRSRIDAAGLAMPENAGFANIDFEHETLFEGLMRYGVSPDEPTFFSWLGVTMYLTRDAIDSVLRSVAAFPVNSEVVLTFLPPGPETGAADGSPSPLASRVAALGEPFVSFFTPDEMEARLLGAGFSRVKFLSPAMAAEQYFQGRHDLPVPRRTGLACAVR